MAWNPDIYNKFKTERYAPFYDLLGVVKVAPGLNAIDLGCGTGELTKILAEYLPGSTILGIGSSQEMLNDSNQFSNEKIKFTCKTIEEQIREGIKWDLVFSNAALQWVDNHRQLFPNIISLINKGGQLAVQVPSNDDHFTHISLQKLAFESPFKEALNGWLHQPPVLAIDEYADIFFKNEGADIIVFEKVYPHILKDADSLYDWVSGTAMIRYIEKLPEELKEHFKDRYRKKLQEQFKSSPIFYGFKRIIMKAIF